MEKMVNRKKFSLGPTNIHIVFRIVKTFGKDICNGTTALIETDKDQRSLLVGIINFKS